MKKLLVGCLITAMLLGSTVSMAFADASANESDLFDAEQAEETIAADESTEPTSDSLETELFETQSDADVSAMTDDGVTEDQPGEEEASEELVLEGVAFGDGLSYQLVQGVLYISGSGPMPEWHRKEEQPWADVRGAITKVIIGDGITSVGSYAFSGCEKLATVTLRPGLTKIGEDAFSTCKSLESIRLPASLEIIEERAFYRCYDLSELTLPKNLKTIGDLAFRECALKQIDVPASVTSIGWWAFNECNELVSVSVPGSVQKISRGMFESCKALESVSLGEGITVIEYYAFYDCPALKTLTLPSSVTEIEACSFLFCPFLSEITIPKGVQSIGEGAFGLINHCAITFEGHPKIDKNAFQGSVIQAYIKLEDNWTEADRSGYEDARIKWNWLGLKENFVVRLYNICLDREPDDPGLKDWVTRLSSGSITGVQTAYGFVFSNEFKNMNLCNTDYVKHLYRALLGRESDPDGLKDWVGRLESGKTREEIFNGFALSPEFSNLCQTEEITRGDGISVPKYGTVPKGKCKVCGAEDGVTQFVKRLYGLCLGRNPDAGGQTDWCNQLWNHTSGGGKVAQGFIFSAEFTGKGYNNEKYLDILYRVFFDRTPDDGGKTNWLNKMDRGMTRRQVFDGFVGSKEFENVCARYGILR